MKKYIALFAFVAAFGVSAVVAGFIKIERGAPVVWSEARTQEKINRLLQQDIANGRTRQLNEDYAATTLDYVNRAEDLDDANLPRDFRRAWRAHVRAWRNHSNFLDKGGHYRSSKWAEHTWRSNVREINRTWERVLTLAEKHGAEIPAGAYE